MIPKLARNCTVNIKSSRLMSILSLSTMTLLILASIVIITIIAVTPIVILGLGELQEGQRDLIITPKLQFINTTKIANLIDVPVMPRLKSPVAINMGQQATGWFMDFELEKKMHLGTIGGDEGPNHNFIYAHEGLGLTEGTTVKVAMLDKWLINVIQRMVSSGQAYTPRKDEVIRQMSYLTSQSIALQGSFVVKEVFSTASGKFGIGHVNNYLYLDIKYAFPQIIRQTYQRMNKDVQKSALIEFLNSPFFRLGDFATEAIVNVPDRVEVYSNPNYDETYIYLNNFGENILTKIGMFSVTTEMPIATNLVVLGYVGMFIGVMLKLIIISLFMLSVIMMNNMLLMGVERKNFDFALLKVMGADRPFIIVNLLTSSLKYVAFANIIAYPLAYLALYGITGVFESFFGYKHEITPTFSSILGGIFIGVLVPIVSSIAPIWGVMNNDLVQNLNPIRNKTEAIKTEIYIEGRQFPFGKLFFGLLATFYGLMIYYLLPKGLINQNVGLLLFVFFIILQGLLIGLILLSYSFQYIFEKIVAYASLFWVNKTDFMLTLKNLSSHRFKNRRSSILYALSVSFIIFVSVGLQIQLQTIYNELLKKRGSYIEITGIIDRQYYNNLLGNIDGVEDWAYLTMPLDIYLARQGVKQIQISDKARLFFATNPIYGVSPNLINTFFFQKVSVYKTDAQSPYDPYSYLYSQSGYMTCTISKYIADRFSILESPNHEFYINIYYQSSLRRIPMNYTSVFDKRIGLLYSSIISRSEIGVSFETFQALAGIPDDSSMPIQKVKVKITNSSEASQIAGRIRQANHNIDTVWDYSQLRDNIDKIANMLNNVLLILLVVVLVISFFSLVTTTYINVINQTNEIGILMILGYQKIRIVRVYIYESFIIVLNSCLIGIAVGYFVAWMMGLQRELFSDLPVTIEINGLPIIILIGIVSSLLSTYKPLREIFNNTISQIMNYSK